jgi:hypothetical protein
MSTMSAGKKEKRPPECRLIPIEGLRVPRPWKIGRVVIHPGTAGRELIRGSPPFESEGDFIEERVLEILDSAHESSLAEIRGVGEIDDAIEAVRASLDALRLFHLARRTTYTTSFGLPGDLHQSRIEYIAIWERSAYGARFRGDPAGWAFSLDDVEDWSNSSGFQFLGAALAEEGPNEGARRATIGAQLFARAATEHRGDLKMLGFVSALEAWLLRRQQRSQTLRLARHVSWFGCGRHDNSLCGRDRPVCPYLHLSPDRRDDRRRLGALRGLGNSYAPWRCSEWHRVMDWYDARSDVAHGDPTSVDPKQADRAEYWIAHYLAEPILDWLGTHAEDPIGELERVLDRIDEPAGWQAMLAALDADNPPSHPPMPQ